MFVFFSISLPKDFNLQRLEDFIKDINVPDVDFVEQPTSWTQRQKDADLSWQQSREQNVDFLLSAETMQKMVCQHCRLREAVIRCGECLPSEWYCVECDRLFHETHTLHNRQTTILGFLKYIPPTKTVKLIDGNYTICDQGLCLFK